MRPSRLLLLGTTAALLSAATPSSAQPTEQGGGDETADAAPGPLRPVNDEPSPVLPPVPEEDDEQERPSIWQDYTGYWDWKFEELLSKPLWGNTTNLPQGILKFRYEYTHARGQTMYNGDGEEVPLLPVISFNDFGAPGRVLVVDPRLSGEGGEHNFQFGYGITDPWNVFVELPFTQAKTTMDLRTYYQGGDELDALERTVFENTIEANGRPLPGEAWETPVSLGDMRVGMSVNYFRNDFFSAGVVPSVRLPTGHPADPDNDITYLRGSELDRGVGAFSTNITSVFDLRPFKWLTFSFEAAANYQFGYDRPAPKWLPITDCARISDETKREALSCPDNRPYDRAYDLEQASTFPDLEKLGDTVHVTPTIAYGVVAAVTLQLTPIPIQFGWQFDRNEAPSLQATGDEDTASAFNQMVKSLQLLEATELHAVALGTSIPLFPLYIPISLQPKAKWIVAGKNLMRLQQQYSIAAELYLPVNDFF